MIDRTECPMVLPFKGDFDLKECKGKNRYTKAIIFTKPSNCFEL